MHCSKRGEQDMALGQVVAVWTLPARVFGMDRMSAARCGALPAEGRRNLSQSVCRYSSASMPLRWIMLRSLRVAPSGCFNPRSSCDT